MIVEEIYVLLEKYFLFLILVFYCDINGNVFYNFSILDCLKGFEKVIVLGFFKFDEFDLNWYE